MSEAILCPQVGQDLTEAKVVALHVKLGDTVRRGQIVAEVESEKATFEVEAFATGVVVGLPHRVGDTATVLEPLVVLGGSTDHKSTAPDRAQSAGSPVKNGSGVPNRQAVARTQMDVATHSASRSSPLARRLAQDNGLDVGRIAGTGPNGAVVMRDVETEIARSVKTDTPITAAAARAGTLNVKSLRDGKGTAVVFIHGFGAEIAAWRQIAMAMSLPNTLLALDLPGHGASPDLPGGFDDMVGAVAASLRGLGSEFHLVGHSLGAAIAIALTARPGISVRSLTLFAPAGLGAAIDGAFVSGFLSARSEAALSVQMRRLVADPAQLPVSMIKATHAARKAGPLMERQSRVAEALFEGSTQLFSVRRELASYVGPVRIVLGRRDDIISSAETEGDLPPHIALHRLENVGHLPFLEAQGLSARLIAETVKSGG